MQDRDVVKQYVTAVGEDLRSHQGQDDRWEGEAHGAAQTLHFLAAQGIIDMETSALIKQEFSTVPEPQNRPDQRTSKAYSVFKESGSTL